MFLVIYVILITLLITFTYFLLLITSIITYNTCIITFYVITYLYIDGSAVIGVRD